MLTKLSQSFRETQNEYKDDESVNPSLLWEMIKLKVREKSLLYSKIKKKQTKQRQVALEQTIARLEKEIFHRKNTNLQNLQLEEQLSEKKGKLERIIETRTKGAILRSKTRWHNEGEKIPSTF